MKPTLPAYRFRVRSRTNPYSSARNLFFSVIAVLSLIAIVAPPVLPRNKWFSRSAISVSTPSQTSHTASSASSSSASDVLSTVQEALFGPSTDTQPKQQSANTRSAGRRLQQTPPKSRPDAPRSAAEVPSAVHQNDSDEEFTVEEDGDDEPILKLRANKRDEANLAYFIQISETTVGHLPRLLNRIYHPENAYVIHFDRKVSKQVSASVRANMFKNHPEYKDNVLFMNPELITYRGVSMLLNTINAMRRLLDFNSNWHYFINLSGADYPTVSQHTMRKLLGRHLEKPLNFLTFAPPSKWDENLEYRMDYIYVDEALTFQSEAGSIKQLGAINPLSRAMKVRYTNAEAWMITSRDLCRFVVTAGYARKMLLTFAYSADPSEHYFSTLVWNHPRFNRTMVDHSMRGVMWEYKGKRAGQHPFNVDDMQNGKYLYKDHILSLPTFFVRKFKKADSPVMDMLDKRWQDDDHNRVVREKFEWHVTKSLREHATKPDADSAERSGST